MQQLNLPWPRIGKIALNKNGEASYTYLRCRYVHMSSRRLEYTENLFMRHSIDYFQYKIHFLTTRITDLSWGRPHPS